MQIASSKTKYAAKVQYLSRIAKFLLKKRNKKRDSLSGISFFVLSFRLISH